MIDALKIYGPLGVVVLILLVVTMRFVAPPLALCTDNAAMIAWAGIELSWIGHPGMVPLVPRPRWPLDDRQPALLGSGRKGAKA